MKIYLDWNVMSQLKNTNDKVGQDIKEKLAEIEGVQLPYSHAHITDLLKGWDGSPEKDKFTRDDLKHIGTVTKNFFLAQYYKAEGVVGELKEPETYFDSVKEESKQSIPDMLDFERLFDEAGFDDDTKTQIQKHFEAEMVRLREENAKIDKSNPEIAKYDAFFPKEGQTFTEFMKQCGAYMQKLMTNPEEYKGIRDNFQTGLGLNPNVVSNWADPVEKLDALLPNTVFGKSLTQHITENNKNASTQNPFYEEFCLVYPTLDMFGFRPESLSEKNPYQNMTNDSQHAFYAAHCQYFITNDKKTLAKSKAAYRHFNVGTVVCTPQEFLKLIEETV
jgi:hypothetical protein